MKRIVRIFLIIGIASTIVGSAILVTAIATSKGDMNSIFNTYTEDIVLEESSSYDAATVDVSLHNANIELEYSDTVDVVTVVYRQIKDFRGESAYTPKKTQDKTLFKITEEETGSFVVGARFATPTVTVILPTNRRYHSITLVTENGWIKADEQPTFLHTTVFYLATENGKIDIQPLAAEKVTATTENGAISAKGVTANEATFTTENGKITIEEADVENLTARSELGSITATLAGLYTDYSVDTDISLGRCNIEQRSGGERKLKITCELGSINVSFLG